MIEYIKQYAKKASEVEQNRYVISPSLSSKEMLKELDRLDPRDFEPSVRCQFLVIRGQIGHFARETGWSPNVYVQDLIELDKVLNGYRGAGSSGIQRAFPYIKEKALRTIIERDYMELSMKLFPAGAWKSTVIMAGSILEAVLHDVLSAPKRQQCVNASPHSVSIKAKKGTVEEGRWDLVDLIKVAADPTVGVLTTDRASTIDQVLRDYRNFVHPKKEIRAKHECSEAEAGLAKYGLDGVCDHLERSL